MSEFPSAKSVAERLNYEIDWTARLEGATITSSTVTVTGATLVSSEVLPKKVVIWISGGTAGAKATVRNVINTSKDQIMEEVVLLQIKAASS